VQERRAVVDDVRTLLGQLGAAFDGGEWRAAEAVGELPNGLLDELEQSLRMYTSVLEQFGVCRVSRCFY
jgi:hypothetical protein